MYGPRERYASEGPGRFGDAELIALVLGTGAARRSALEIGAEVASRFDGLAGVASADPAELARVPGVGPTRAIRLHAAVQLGRRSLQRPPPPHPIHGPEDAVSLLAPALSALEHEELHALYLDRRHHPLAIRPLTRGSDAFTVVDPRQVFRIAVRLGAAGVLVAHNHPSGDPTPSAQDRDVTRRLRQAGEVLGIQLVDHLVIAGNRWARVDA